MSASHDMIKADMTITSHLKNDGDDEIEHESAHNDSGI